MIVHGAFCVLYHAYYSWEVKQSEERWTWQGLHSEITKKKSKAFANTKGKQKQQKTNG